MIFGFHWCADETFALLTVLSMLPGVRFLIQKWLLKRKSLTCQCENHHDSHPARTTIIPSE